MISKNNLRELLRSHGLRITPQRLIVIDALFRIKNHPTAEEIARFVRNDQPNIATGTIYHILEILVNKGLLAKVKTDHDVMRYDIVVERHHHLYCSDCNQIEDYYNDELNSLIDSYFKDNQIPGFTIDEIKLHINGRFEDKTRHRMIRKESKGK